MQSSSNGRPVFKVGSRAGMATWRGPDCRPIAAACYERRRELAKLLPLWPHELSDESPAGRRRLVRELRKALRAERRRGVAGHWTYDLARHAQLLRAYRIEVDLMREPAPPP